MRSVEPRSEGFRVGAGAISWISAVSRADSHGFGFFRDAAMTGDERGTVPAGGGEPVREVDASDVVEESQIEPAAAAGPFWGRMLRAFLAGLRRVWRILAPREIRSGRDERWGPAGDAGAVGGDVDEPGASTASPMGRLLRAEENRRLLVVASWCPEEDRALIALHLFEGLTHREVADRLGMPADRARQRHARAVRRLGEALTLVDLLARHGVGGPAQEAVVRRLVWGVDPEEIGGQLGVPAGLVERWIAEGRALIRDDAGGRT